jgi:hypothetical protein
MELGTGHLRGLRGFRERDRKVWAKRFMLGVILWLFCGYFVGYIPLVSLRAAVFA